MGTALQSYNCHGGYTFRGKKWLYISWEKTSTNSERSIFLESLFMQIDYSYLPRISLITSYSEFMSTCLLVLLNLLTTVVQHVVLFTALHRPIYLRFLQVVMLLL